LLSDEVRFSNYKLFPETSLTSKPINTKQITKLLNTIQFGGTKNLELDINFIENQLGDLEISEEPKLQLQQEIPPKNN
jgi:hypothetical protein